MQRRQFLKNRKIGEDIISNKIYYVTSNYNIIKLDNNGFNANITLNTRDGNKNIIVFDNSVTDIGDNAFVYCSNLTSITLPESVKSIGYSAFYYCSNLTSITIPDRVTSIGDYAFGWCYSLTSINIPESVTSIGGGAFDSCSGLTAVHISSIEAWCRISFSNSNSNPLRYANNLYLNGEIVTELVIPESITSISNYSFYSCTSLTTITIPESVTSIGSSAFEGCSGLTSITIPESVTSIGGSAFASCEDLTSVHSYATTPPVIDDSTFRYSSITMVIYVPDSSVDAYMSSTHWFAYTGLIKPMSEYVEPTTTETSS